MCNTCNERESSNSRDVSVDDLKRSRSPLGPHRSKLVIICLTFSTLARQTYGGVGGGESEKGSGVRRLTYTISRKTAQFWFSSSCSLVCDSLNLACGVRVWWYGKQSNVT